MVHYSTVASFGSPPPIGLLPVVLSKTEYGCNSSLGDETAPEDVEEGELLLLFHY